MMETSSDILRFLGRLHVVLLHLPIGLVVLLGVLELLAIHPRWRHATSSNRFVLWLAAPLSVLTAASGWLLAGPGDYDERVLAVHRWTGVGVAVAACGLLWVHRMGWLSLYRVVLMLAVGLTLVAGHFGAALTHGSDYLRRYAPFWLGGRGPWDSGGSGGMPGQGAELTFTVSSILSEYCVSCHGPERAKGGLRLDTMEHLLAGGDSGRVLKPGNASGSLLLNRMKLPLDHEDHMPPEGKPQPEPREIQAIRDWILSGAGE